MRKSLVTILVAIVVAGASIATVFEYEKRDNADRVKRAQDIVHELQKLEVGKPDHTVADRIAMKFGYAPPPESLGRYTKEYCAAPERDEGNCVYFILMNNSPVEAVLERHRFLRRMGFHEWSGTAMIIFRAGRLTDYSFVVWYIASNDRLRGFGFTERQSLPRFEEGAHMSDAYSVLPFKTVHTSLLPGIGLQSAVTPSASASERQRASHIDFDCLSKRGGCGEVCTVMPEAWEDYYEKFGRREVDRHGTDYILCSHQPK